VHFQYTRDLRPGKRRIRAAPAIVGYDAMPYTIGRVTRPTTAMLLAARGIIVAVLVAMRRPPPVGLCSACGYDLTGNTSGRCPECGRPA